MSRVKRILELGGNFMAASALWMTMNTRDEQFFKELGARIAQARKDHGLTQQALAEQLGVAQQTLAHYEVGRARMPASMLPDVARLLTLSLDELMVGQPTARARRSGKRGPVSRLQQQIEAVAQLPKTKQQFVSQMLDTVLAQVSP
jgi:transcriptional regulator with XRE-family HTH domain